MRPDDRCPSLETPAGARRGSARRAGVAPVVVLALLGLTADAAPWGVPLGKGSVKAVIGAPGDVDSYLVEAPAGARISARIRLPRSSELEPSAELLGPTGTVVDALFTAGKNGLALPAFTVGEGGRYEIRVSGAGGTEGGYTISARVRGSARVALRDVTFVAGEERAFPFTAGGGARLSFQIAGRHIAPSFVRIESPLGNVVSVAEGAVRRTSNRLRAKRIDLPTSAPFGEWLLVLDSPSAALSDIRVQITPRGGTLATARGRLADVEPRLLAVTPTEAGPGATLRLSGADLSSLRKRPFRMFVGGVEATGVVLEGTGLATGVVPSGPRGVVDVSVLDGSGHAVVLPAAFEAVPPPRPTSFLPVRGPAAGGTVVVVRGVDFRPSSAVTIAGTAFTAQTEFVDATTLRLTTPEFAGGKQAIGVVDPTGQTGAAPGSFEFVSGPILLDVLPRLVPALPGEVVRIVGGNFDASQAVSIGGVPVAGRTVVSSTQLDAVVPELGLGAHAVRMSDGFGQSGRAPNDLAVFGFAAGPPAELTDVGAPTAVALSDFDHDGDLDLFVASAGGAATAGTSRLHVLRNDGSSWTDVTVDVLPDVSVDDWRADAIAFGDVAGPVGGAAPDGWDDLVLGTLDASSLAANRSRVRILANRVSPGGARVFVDRTEALMTAVSGFDDWRASDLWVGDLDGDGGVADIVATHDANATGETPLTPYYVQHLSGTRVFSYLPGPDDTAGGFAWDAERLPRFVGTRVPTSGFPTCVGDECADDYTPFRGRSLDVLDLDGDGRLDLAVSSPSPILVDGRVISSTQIARNVENNGSRAMTDHTADLAATISTLMGDIVLAGDVTGSPAADLVVVRRTSEGVASSIEVAVNRGFGSTWSVATTTVLPASDGTERHQADDAALVDVDGDGDLDLLLLADVPPSLGSTTTGRGLRVLRNVDGAFVRNLEPLLPAATAEEDWTGTRVTTGDLGGDGGLGLVMVRADAAGTGISVRCVLRTTND